MPSDRKRPVKRLDLKAPPVAQVVWVDFLRGKPGKRVHVAKVWSTDIASILRELPNPRWSSGVLEVYGPFTLSEDLSNFSLESSKDSLLWSKK